MKDITSKVSKSDMDSARIDRKMATDPADVEPGMDDFWDNMGDDLGDSGGGSGFGGGGGEGFGSNDPFGSSGGGFGGGGFGNNDPFGGGGFGGGGFGNDPFGGGGGFGQQQKPPNSDEKLEEAAKKVLMGFVTFTKDLATSFKTYPIEARLNTGKTIIYVSVGSIVLGIIAMLFGLGGVGLNLLLGGLLASAAGVPLFMFSYGDIVSGKTSLPPQPSQEYNPFAMDEDEEDIDMFGSSDDDDDSLFDMDGDDEDLDLFGGADDDDDVDYSVFESKEDDMFSSQTDFMSAREEVLDKVDIDRGMVTRGYLYENISSVLQPVNNTFHKTKEIPEGSDEFDAWDYIIQSSAKLFKPRGNDVEMPYLVSAKDRVFYVMLEISRVSWLKNIDAFVTEIVSICQFDKNTGKTDLNIYGIGNTVGDRIYVKVMKGDTALITIRDAYTEVESDITNNKNYMPVVLGLDAEGSVVWKDFKDINSILVTGMPRSGKTWVVMAVLAQMASYLKPSELHFHILDPKAEISDFRQLEIPHIRKFVASDAEIISELRHIVKVEGPRRKRIIGDQNFVNIWDYKKANPDTDLPLLYVVIDEVITLAERMDKETKDEFQGLLLELVSQLPALGIRIFMIPHVVKDQVLKKSITDLIPCRISVRGDADHVEKSVGAKNFKHKLIHQGDMAVRFNNDDPMFIHSVVLADSNEGNADFFNFLLKFWGKIEPESLKGSLHEFRQVSKGKNGTYFGSDQLVTDSQASVKEKINITRNLSKNTPQTPKTSVAPLSKTDQDELLKDVKSDDFLWEE